jgi:putative solute:sodium symporter small subunit
MDKAQQPATAPDYRVNFFRPRAGYMRRRVIYTWILLGSWAFFTFGFQLLLAAIGRHPAGESALTESIFLGFPFHYWFTGQFLIVWFIFLCLLFNLFVDHLADIYRKRR